MATGRVVVCRTMRVAGSYTLETSLGGCSKTGAFAGIRRDNPLISLAESACVVSRQHCYALLNMSPYQAVI
eukprot:scaffold150053_cov34-Prasinocladus_malaysianus.AAC.1